MKTCQNCGNDFDDRKGTCPFCGETRQFAGTTGKRSESVRTVNIKKNQPTVEEALAQLEREITSARAAGVKVLKVIHGYGASGVGGKIRHAVRNELKRARLNTIPGEAFSSRSEPARALLNRMPRLQNDPDLNKSNEGMVLVVLS